MNTSRQRVLDVRRVRLLQLERQVAEAAANLAAEEARLHALNEELQHVLDQRRSWEQQWQQWLQGDGVLHRGHFFNLRNLSVAAWEADVLDRREPIAQAKAEALATLEEVRSRLRPAYLRVRTLESLLKADALRECSTRDERLQSETLDEVTSYEWVAHPPCGS
ncbi:MAG TPA: hypothetical protein VFS47_01585 [Steroidobacteraceae bacterium]|nr:hypothetical protein [Steroidobacteraceae bacterium]